MKITITPPTDTGLQPYDYDGCFGTVDDDRSLTVVQLSNSHVVDTIPPAEWASYEVVNDDAL